MWSADAKWLATTFFMHFSDSLAQPGIAVTIPADAIFLTQGDLDMLSWDSQQWCGDAWKRSVQTALKRIGIEDRYELLKQRFPQGLAAIGVHQAGM